MLTRFQTVLTSKENCSRGARYFNTAANERIGRDVYDHLTGSGAQSLMCLLPIFDPDGVGQNPLDFFPFHRVRFLNTQVRSLRLCVNIDLVRICAFA
jgi:hypothetical protein